MTHPAFRDKGSKLNLPCGTRDRVCKSGTVPDVSGRLAAMVLLMTIFEGSAGVMLLRFSCVQGECSATSAGHRLAQGWVLASSPVPLQKRAWYKGSKVQRFFIAGPRGYKHSTE